MSKLLFFDSTLRDGSHAIKHQYTKDNITAYCHAIDKAGMHTVIVGHGNGLGASSLQVGLSNLSDHEMLETARETLHKTKLGAFMIPGFGTISDEIDPAIKDGVELFCIASHCTEADVTKQHIEHIRKKGAEAYGVLMMYHMASTEKILEEASKMQDYGAQGVIIMDSAGASTPEMVKRTIATLSENLTARVGFHAHNNLGMAVGNSYIAIQEGATIIDGTIRGLGAGAGNMQIEALVALLIKNNYELDVNFYAMLDASEKVVKEFFPVSTGLTDISIVSGMAGVFSGFAAHVKAAAKEFQVDPRDIFIELGKRKVVGGQEDQIVDVAVELKKKNEQSKLNYQIETLT